jgi:hypothetical protein
MKKMLAYALAAGTAAALFSTFAAGDAVNSDRNSQFDFALIGDVPYAPTGLIGTKNVQTYPSPEYDALVADINDHNKVLFTVHVGDIKAGNTWCVGGISDKDPVGAANIYTTNVSLFNNFRNGLIYVPGDNEWTDCHRTNNGAYNPTERLAYLRSVFFTTNQSLGQRTFAVTRQANYPENVMWRTSNIIFVGINQPGSNNNLQRNIAASSPPPTDNNTQEYTDRNNANIAWVNKAFDDAAADANTKAVVIMQQANPFERFLEAGQGYKTSGYQGFITTLRNRTVTFGKPVVLVGGDTHTIRVDKPLTTLYPGVDQNGVLQPATAGTRIQNFSRVEVFGSPDTHWVRVVVDPFDPNVFSFSAQTITGNGHGRDGRTDDDDLQ